MQRTLLIVAGIVVALGAAARAEAPDGPKRTHTFTTEYDVTRMDKRAASDRSVIFILRGTERKEQTGVTLAPPEPEPAPKAAEPAPQPKKHKRGWNRN
jgi:hypothetical protein